MTVDERDDRLGTALLELEVPDHRPRFFDELRVELVRAPAARSRTWLLAPGAAVAAVLAIAVAFALTRGSEPASAAGVRAAVERAFSADGSIAGVFVSDESGDPHSPGVRWRFVVSSSGAFRIDGLGSHSERVYDPVANVESNSDGASFVRRIGLAPGPPDAAPADFVVQSGLGSVVAALATARDPKVEEVTYEGRPAWLLRTSTGNPGEQRLITVDRATGIPVRNEVRREGRVASVWRIEELQVTSSIPAIEPVEPGPDQIPQTYNAGFRRIAPTDAAGLAGYEPLVPQSLPSGFELSAVAFAESSRSTGEEDGGNPPSRDVLSFAYRNGFDEIVVTTRRTVSSPDAWKDPLQVSTAVTSEPERIVFTDGALAGRTGRLVLEPDALPHVWTSGESLVVTIAGNVAPAELLLVANSLGVG